jgi:hypothetical protein
MSFGIVSSNDKLLAFIRPHGGAGPRIKVSYIVSYRQIEIRSLRQARQLKVRLEDGDKPPVCPYMITRLYMTQGSAMDFLGEHVNSLDEAIKTLNVFR